MNGLDRLSTIDMLSIVIPVFNEEQSLAPLRDELDGALTNERDAEFIFVDDGSTDRSWSEILALAAKDSRVRGIRFRRNFGKAAALQAGFRASAGEIVMTLDADLQDDPREISRFLLKIDAGCDVVSGWKQRRQDPWHKVWPSRLFNFVVSRVSGVKLHDHNCGMKAYRREAIEDLRLYGELHRYIPVLLASHGFQVGEIPIQHRARLYGASKYGVRRFTRGLFDLITVTFLTSHGDRPMHVLGAAGLGTWLLSAIAALGSAFFAPDGSFVLLLIAVASFLVGVQCLLTGIVAELVVAQGHRRHEAPYDIAEDTKLGLPLAEVAHDDA